ncbi:MAG: sensor histidine kinase [Emticicia sp.]|uniref:sensor histidine kinase n=1 Tax=Emticicia sp. TaxID=1930953 RepID=UPI003BA71D93
MKKRIGFHVVCWIAFLIYIHFLYFLEGYLDSKFIWRTILNYLPIITFFYLNAYILRILIPQRRFLVIISITATMLLIYVAIRYFYKFYLFDVLGIPDIFFDRLEPKKLYIESIWLFFNYLIYSYCYWFFLHSISLQKERAKLQKDVFLQEKARISAELAFLQAQINPHFLFNTLNFIYSEAVMVSDKLAKSLMTLSEMMRYVTTVSSTQQHTPIESELKHIENFIQIQQMRFHNALNISMITEGRSLATYTSIPPLILISFVDNAFKYGDLYDDKYPLSIETTITETSFNFKIFNKKANNLPPMPSTKTGLTNAKQRLALMYKERHSLKILDNEDSFTVELFIEV